MSNTPTYHKIKQALVEKELKATTQRIFILEALLATREHPSAEELFASVKDKIPGVSLATIYKTLETFTEVGLASKVMNHEGNLRYDGFTDQHHHIYCLNTSEIIDYNDPELEVYLKKYFEKKEIKNIDIKNINIQIHGNKINKAKNISIK